MKQTHHTGPRISQAHAHGLLKPHTGTPLLQLTEMGHLDLKSPQSPAYFIWALPPNLLWTKAYSETYHGSHCRLPRRPAARPPLREYPASPGRKQHGGYQSWTSLRVPSPLLDGVLKQTALGATTEGRGKGTRQKGSVGGRAFVVNEILRELKSFLILHTWAFSGTGT